jgi:hypothetical protein
MEGGIRESWIWYNYIGQMIDKIIVYLYIGYIFIIRESACNCILKNLGFF